MKLTIQDIIRQPLVTEKSTRARENRDVYCFKADARATLEALRPLLEAKGHRFRTVSDTEVILALYRRHGVGCLNLLRGMFALAIWDEQRQQLVLDIDNDEGSVGSGDSGDRGRHRGR